MVERIALVGGDEFCLGCEDMDLGILGLTEVSNPRVLILPTAAAEENPEKAVSNGVEYFLRLGIRAKGIPVLNSEDANNLEFASYIGRTDVIYLTGGNPEYLIKTLRQTIILNEIIKAISNGIILIASSAGAMVLGTSMYRGTWQNGLDIVNKVAILPHYEIISSTNISGILNDAPNHIDTILGIDSRTACLGALDNWDVLGIGNVTLYERDKSRNDLFGEKRLISG